MTKEEAEKIVAAKNSELPTWLCPLINAPCTPACICFVADRVVQTSKNDYAVRKKTCNNAMFSNKCGCR